MAKKASTKNPIVQDDINTPVDGIHEVQTTQHENNTIQHSTVGNNNNNNNDNDNNISTPATTTNKQQTNNSNIYDVQTIIQKRPSHYNLLLKNGDKVVVSKDQFNRHTMKVTL